MVVGSQAGLEVRSWPDLAPSRTMATSMAQVHDLAFSPRGDVLAVAGGDPAEAGVVELFAWPSGDLIHRGEPHGDSVLAVAWRADSAALATASLDRTARLHSAGGERGAHSSKGTPAGWSPSASCRTAGRSSPAGSTRA